MSIAAPSLEPPSASYAVVIASTDMSHHPSYQNAAQVWMARGVDNLFCTLCGEGPTLAAMIVARKVGGDPCNHSAGR